MSAQSAATTRSAVEAAIPVRTSARPARRFAQRVPIFYRVLFANSAIIALGAIAGTAITTEITRRASDRSVLPLIVLFAGIGIALSLVVNILVLRAAFRPMNDLILTAQALQEGDLDARASVDPASDPEMAQLANALNTMLDELAEDRTQLRDLANQVIRAQEDERRRVSRELHDDTAQILFAQLLQVTALKSSPEPSIQSVAERLEQSTVDALEGVRRLALELRPPALDDLGLADALTELCQRFNDQSGLTVTLDVRGMRGRLSPDMELVLYRVAQEALTNTAKHARATQATVRLERTSTDVSLAIRDNGIGFDRERFKRSDGIGLGLGLFGMEERAALLGGRLRVWSAPGQGTEVFAFLPLSKGTGGK